MKNFKNTNLSVRNILTFTVIVIIVLSPIFLSSVISCKILPTYQSESKAITQDSEIDTIVKEEIKYLEGEEIMLPEPRLKSDFSLEEAMAKRRSIRDFTGKGIEIEKISQLLWAAQGITEKSSGKRTAPSAGALYPMELFIVMKDGTYHYVPEEHKLMKISSEDLRQKLSAACIFQQSVSDAAIDIVLTAIYERTTIKYGERGIRYVHMEAGHVCQNILLTSVSLGLGAVPIGAFDDSSVQKLLNLPSHYMPLYVIPVGYPED
jgi:SagB-type dehydrogenase family enzyme